MLKRLRVYINSLIRPLLNIIPPWISPSFFTFISFILAGLTGVFFAKGVWVEGGVCLIFCGLLDILDGELARKRGKTEWGGFLDSTLDRYADLFVLSGCIYFFRYNNLILIYSLFSLMGALLTSYTRAKAERFISSCRVGWIERPERLSLLILGSLLQKMEIALLLLAILSNITPLYRIYYTYKEMKR